MSALPTTESPLDLATPPTSPLTAVACHEELAAWDQLSIKGRAEVLRWLPHVQSIAAAGHGQRAVAVDRAARIMGVSTPTARRKFDDWKLSGWQGLVNGSRDKVIASKLPPAFVQFWLGLVESYQRDQTGKAAHRALLTRLTAWERGDDTLAIPGYARPPKRTALTGIPEGWSYRALIERKPCKYQLALRRQGPKAASNFLPSVRTSRLGVPVGKFFIFDDEMSDVYTNFHGVNTQATRPLAFHCLDYTSYANITRGYQPVIEKRDPATGKPTGEKSTLTKANFQWFIIHILTDIGYRPDGTICVVEHGTASGGKKKDLGGQDFDDRVRLATDGKVTFDRSGLFGSPGIRDMIYSGQASGNFRYKPIEGFFSAMRIPMSMLPGATGLSRGRAPEETHGLLRENKWLLAQLEKMPLERRILAREPVLPWGKFVELANGIIADMNGRREHEIGQWEQCGFTATEYTLDGQTWFGSDALQRMPEAQRAAVTAFVCQPGFSRIQRLSPQEVWEQGKRELVRLPRRSCVSIVDPEFAIEKKVSDRLEFEFFDRTISPEPMSFIARAQDAQGRNIELKRGEVYLCFLNPLNPDYLQVCEAHGARRGAWIGEAHRTIIASRHDVDALVRNYGQVMAATAHSKADVARRAAGESARRNDDREWNRRLLNPAPLTPKEHAAHDAALAAAALADLALSNMKATAPEPDHQPETFDPFSGED